MALKRYTTYLETGQITELSELSQKISVPVSKILQIALNRLFVSTDLDSLVAFSVKLSKPSTKGS